MSNSNHGDSVDAYVREYLILYVVQMTITLFMLLSYLCVVVHYEALTFFYHTLQQH